MFIKKNNSKSVVNMGGGVLEGGITSLTVGDGGKFPSTQPFLITIWDKAIFPDPTDESGMEIVKCTNRAGNVLTIVRGQEGTTDQAHTNGEAVEMLITAGILQELNDKGYASVDADSGTINYASYTQRVRLTYTPAFSGDFLVKWYTEYSVTNNKPVFTKVEQDDATILGEETYYRTTGGIGVDYKARGGFVKVTLVAGTSYNFDMDVHSASQNMTIRRSRLSVERFAQTKRSQCLIQQNLMKSYLTQKKNKD